MANQRVPFKLQPEPLTARSFPHFHKIMKGNMGRFVIFLGSYYMFGSSFLFSPSPGIISLQYNEVGEAIALPADNELLKWVTCFVTESS